jgi:hypothetical protein
MTASIWTFHEQGLTSHDLPPHIVATSCGTGNVFIIYYGTLATYYKTKKDNIWFNGHITLLYVTNKKY